MLYSSTVPHCEKWQRCPSFFFLQRFKIQSCAENVVNKMSAPFHRQGERLKAMVYPSPIHATAGGLRSMLELFTQKHTHTHTHFMLLWECVCLSTNWWLTLTLPEVEENGKIVWHVICIFFIVTDRKVETDRNWAEKEGKLCVTK